MEVKTKAEKCERWFRAADGEMTPRVTLDTEVVIFKFNDHAKSTLEMPLDALGPLPPVGVARAAMAFGINTSVGNALGAIKDAELLHDAAAERWETLTSGSWESGREGGPRVGDLVEALARIKAERDGVRPDQAWIDALKVKVSHPDFDRKGYMANAGVRSKIDMIKIERLQEAAAKSAAAASNAPDLGDILA